MHDMRMYSERGGKKVGLGSAGSPSQAPNG